MGKFLKITALFYFLMMAYSLESYNSDEKMKLLLLFFIVASIELMKTPLFFRRSFPNFM